MEYYEPYGKIKQTMVKEYEGHKPRLEDFWENLQDNFEVREENHYRLSVPQIRIF